MLQFLKSLFGVGETKARFPGSFVKEAVERAVDGTDPCLRIVSGYKRKLTPSVRLAIDWVNALVDGLPPARPIGVGSRVDDPLVRAFFISEDEICRVIRNDRDLAGFLRNAETVPEKVAALLVMEKNETVSFGAEMSGDTVERDMPRKIITFESHRLLDPSGEDSENRLMLKRRAYDHLVSLALGRITTMKTERQGLERRRELLQSKLDMMRRTGWGFEASGLADGPDIPGFEEEIGNVGSQLLELGGDDRIFDEHLDIVIDVLGRPGEHLWGKTETVILDSMGVLRDEAAANAVELTFHGLFNSEGRRLVVLPVVLDGAEIRDLKRLPKP